MGIEAPKGLAKGSHGNGLVNMRKRAQESGMEIIINSGTARGTEIILQFKI
jgi:signal transduction histidine kinase